MNYSGELWYREGLPSDVFRRLVVRKENETPLDRFSGDYEELMTYANFRDLADIIVGNEALKERLTVLEPRGGSGLLDRLSELEEIKRNLASSRSASAEDEAKLQQYFDEFRAAIKRGKRTAGSQSTGQVPPSETEVEPTPEEETIDSIFDEEEAPAPPAKNRPGRLVVKVSADGLRQAASDAESRPSPEPEEPDEESDEKPDEEPEEKPDEEFDEEPDEEPEAEPSPAVANDMGSMKTPVTDVSVNPGPRDTESKGPIEVAEGLEAALRDEDDAAILKALHIEVTEIADGMLRRDPKHGHLVWEQANERGWLEDRREEYELDPLDEFYELAQTFLDAYSSGAKSSELKAILAEIGFSKMLLNLREMFLSSRAKA